MLLSITLVAHYLYPVIRGKLEKNMLYICKSKLRGLHFVFGASDKKNEVQADGMTLRRQGLRTSSRDFCERILQNDTEMTAKLNRTVLFLTSYFKVSPATQDGGALKIPDPPCLVSEAAKPICQWCYKAVYFCAHRNKQTFCCVLKLVTYCSVNPLSTYTYCSSV